MRVTTILLVLIFSAGCAHKTKPDASALLPNAESEYLIYGGVKPPDAFAAMEWRKYLARAQRRWSYQLDDAAPDYPAGEKVVVSLAPEKGNLVIKELIGGTENAQKYVRKALEEVIRDTPITLLTYEWLESVKVITLSFVYLGP